MKSMFNFLFVRVQNMLTSALRVKINEKQNVIYIEVENTHNENITPKGKLFETTKGEKAGHGIGLKNVSQIVEKYNGEMEFTFTDRIFCVKVMMYKD